MTYDKETREELVEGDHMEDIIKEERLELANEIDDGAMDTWIIENHSSLTAEFVGDHDEEFREYCKSRWNEVNE